MHSNCIVPGKRNWKWVGKIVDWRTDGKGRCSDRTDRIDGGILCTGPAPMYETHTDPAPPPMYESRTAQPDVRPYMYVGIGRRRMTTKTMIWRTGLASNDLGWRGRGLPVEEERGGPMSSYMYGWERFEDGLAWQHVIISVKDGFLNCSLPTLIFQRSNICPLH